MSGNKRVLSNRRYCSYLLAETISAFGNGFNQISLLFVVQAATNSPAATGISLAVGSAIRLVIRAFAGYALDMLNTKRVIVLAEALSGLASCCFGVISAASQPSVALIILYVLIYNSTCVFFESSTDLLMPRLVKRSQLLEANSISSSVLQVAQIAGPGAAGAIISVLGASVGLIVDGATSIISSLMLLLIRIPMEQRTSTRKNDFSDRSFRQCISSSIVEPVRLIANSNMLGITLAATAIANLALASVDIVLPVYSQDFPVPSELTTGWLLTAVTLGMVIGPQVGKALADHFSFRYGLAIGAICTALPFVGMALANSAILSSGLFCLIGIGMGVQSLLVSVIWQRETKATMRGRLFAIKRITAHAGDPLALGAVGFLLSAVSPRVILAAYSFICFFAAVMYAKGMRGSTEDGPQVVSGSA